MTKPKGTQTGAKEIILKDGTEGLKVWKPIKKGETVTGKLIAISETKYNPVLRIKTDSGVESVPVSTFLEDIDFESYIGDIITFVYQGVVGRGCKIYKVSVTQENLPF